MGKRAWYLLVVCAVAAAIAPSVAQGIVVTPIDDDYDTWIRQSSPGTAYISDGIWASTDGFDGGQERKGVVQFNLSGVGVPITSAHLELPALSGNDVTLAPTGWVNSSVQPGNVMTLTYADYELFIQPSEVPFAQLGGATFSVASLPSGTYGVTNVANAADLSVLNTIRSGDGIITMIFTATSGGREFDDIGTNWPVGVAPAPFRLVLNEALPVPGDLDGDFDVDVMGDYAIFKANWLQTVPNGTLGDFNGSGKVTLADFSLFKGYYDDFTGGGGGELSPVPEPGTLVLLAAAIPAALWAVKRRKLA